MNNKLISLLVVLTFIMVLVMFIMNFTISTNESNAQRAVVSYMYH